MTALVGLLVTSSLGAAAGAPAADHRGDLVAPAFAREALGGDVERLPNGLYRVRTPAGYTMTTHGPDTTALADQPDDDLSPGDPERAPVCATGHVAHVLYGRPAIIAQDRLSAVEDEIRAHVARMNHVLNASSLESGGPEMDLKLLCDDSGKVRVDSFVNNTFVSYFSTVVDAARAAGFADPLVDYIIFYDDIFPGVCGVAEFARDDRATPDNRNNEGGYGITYRNCWYSRTPLHENGHNQGAVQSGAPNDDGTSHCTEQRDIMCYPSSSTQCQVQWYDCGFDTYFDSAPEDGEWLASHWNIGAPANRYIQIGGSHLRDPGLSFEVSDKTPARGARVRAEASLVACPDLAGTTIELQRQRAGNFETTAQSKVDEDCLASFRIRANFSSAVFRAVWSAQNDLYNEAVSASIRIRTN